MIRITSLIIILIFGFQQHAHAFEVDDLGTFSYCFSDRMEVLVNLTHNPDLVPEEMHLNKNDTALCRIQEKNDTFAKFDIPFSGCGTERYDSDPNYLVFSNVVRWAPKPDGNQIQTRIPKFASRITCKYRSNGTVSTFFKPVQELTVNQTIYGRFTFTFNIYVDNGRTELRNLNVPVIPGTPLYFRVEVTSSDSDLVLHLSKCWAVNDEGDGPVFILNGCGTGEVDPLDYQCNADSATQDFRLNAFRILPNPPNDNVYFRCDVIVCLLTANSSICKDRCDNCTSQGGGGVGRRRRRAVEEEKPTGYDPGSKTFSLSLGPLRKEEGSGKDQKNQQDEKGTGLTLTMLVVLSVTVIVAVALICGTIIMVIMYKKWSKKHKNELDGGNIPPKTKHRKPKVIKL